MLRKLYAWALKMAHHKHAAWVLFCVSFAESSFFPIPPDTMLLPMCLANRKKALWFATICTAASVLGGIVGYALGAWLYETVGHLLIKFYGMEDQIETFRTAYREYGTAIILIKGFTPIPYKLVSIASGLAGYPLLAFIILSAITRGARFYLIATLLYFYGAPIKIFVEKHLEKVTLGLLAGVILGFIAFKYML